MKTKGEAMFIRQVGNFILLALFLDLLACAQGTAKTKVYQIPGAANGAVGEYETEDQLKLLEDFDQSKYLEEYDHAVLTNDKRAFDRLIADRAVYVGERFGQGENLDKAGVLSSFGEKNVIRVSKHTRDHVRLRAFGKDTVIMTGNSTSVLTINGKLSEGTRLFANTYMKLDGRWQCVVHTVVDYKGLLPGSRLNPESQ